LEASVEKMPLYEFCKASCGALGNDNTGKFRIGRYEEMVCGNIAERIEQIDKKIKKKRCEKEVNLKLEASVETMPLYKFCKATCGALGYGECSQTHSP